MSGKIIFTGLATLTTMLAARDHAVGTTWVTWWHVTAQVISLHIIIRTHDTLYCGSSIGIHPSPLSSGVLEPYLGRFHLFSLILLALVYVVQSYAEFTQLTVQCWWHLLDCSVYQKKVQVNFLRLSLLGWSQPIIWHYTPHW